MTKLLLADDHDLVREMIAEYLRVQGGFDVFVAESLESALKVQEKNVPFQLVMLDLMMPGMDSLSGLAVMKSRAGCPVAILSGTGTPEVARRALRSWAAGFLPKTLDPQSLVAAVHHMLLGETYTPLDFLESGDTEAEGKVHLTPRETDVLVGVLDGKSNKEIARDLDIQEVTVKLHLKTLSRKLGAKNRTQAAMIARDMGLT
ncbi:response regulator transcription factor [Roseovarius sp. 217]|uniref:response regulator transcription factor n=1 Tax=Roseovarius sp. (strain 217) TaxID=314264 RepID=UPI0000685B5E|nr:response regulator transcription factor [Roseovarius sp. 217]EAQ26609.1 DNA-binding response regulator, LuxR family protein [Roseovarius sp. 217]